MNKRSCPWCGHEIDLSKDRQNIRFKKKFSCLLFAKCSHCLHYYGRTLKSKRKVLEKMTPDQKIFKDVKHYAWDITTDSLTKRLSYYKSVHNGFFDEDFVITSDKKYGIFFYNICEVGMCNYLSAVAIFSSENLNEPLIDLKPMPTDLTGPIAGYKRYFYAPLSDCIITVCKIHNKDIPFLLIKPAEKKFAIIPFDYTSIYYSLNEIEKGEIILEDESINELKALEVKGYIKQTGKQFSLSDLNWCDIAEFENIEKIYTDLKTEKSI